MRSDQKKEISKILNNCLHLINTSQATVEDCLARYPEYRKSLEPLLRTYALLKVKAASEGKISPAFKTKTKSLFLEAAQAQPTLTSLLSRVFSSSREGIERIREKSRRWALPATKIIAVNLVILLLLGSFTVVASARSLPGDSLYKVKAFVERVQLSLAFGSPRKSNLNLRFAQRRLEELEKIAGKGKQQVIEATLSALEENLTQASEYLNKVPPDQGKKLQKEYQKVTRQSKAVLERVYLKVPQPAKGAIEKAIEKSQQYQKAPSHLEPSPKEKLEAPQKTPGKSGEKKDKSKKVHPGKSGKK